jgi:hypothetical protein
MADQFIKSNGSTVPITLTDHFKQALNMTKTQLQNGPSALTSAAQMGVTFAPPNNYPQTYGAGVRDISGIDGLNYPFQQQQQETFFSKYGKWIFIAVVIAGGLFLWMWWKRRKNSIEESMQQQRPLIRRQRPPLPPPTQQFNPSQQQHQHQHQQQPLSIRPPPTEYNQQTRDIREREHDVGNRGAEYTNPLLAMSPMVPVSTRLSDGSGEGLNSNPQPMPHPQQQPYHPPPPVSSQSQTSPPPVSSQPSFPVSSQPPSLSPPISSQPSSPPPQPHANPLPVSSPQADPNFTPV